MVVLESGERLPMLCARETGVPLFEPTVWALASFALATELAPRSSRRYGPCSF
jgi:hypothetical protein